MPEMPEPRIFAIGVSKTGTSSLNRALMKLGQVSLHYPGAYFNRQAETKAAAIKRGEDSLVADFGASDWHPDYWNALTNCNEHEYPECDSRYPGSKFILTTREADGWDKSLSRWFPHDRPGGGKRSKALAAFMDKQRIRVWGRTDYGRVAMREMYEAHEAGVLSYFENRVDDLLVLPVETPDPDKWTMLCIFLDLPRHLNHVQDRNFPYPHRNAQDYDGTRVAKRKLKEDARCKRKGPEAVQALTDRRANREALQNERDEKKGGQAKARRKQRREAIAARVEELRGNV